MSVERGRTPSSGSDTKDGLWSTYDDKFVFGGEVIGRIGENVLVYGLFDYYSGGFT